MGRVFSYLEWVCWRRVVSCSRAERMGPGVTGSFSMESSRSAAWRMMAMAWAEWPSDWVHQAESCR